MYELANQGHGIFPLLILALFSMQFEKNLDSTGVLTAYALP